MAIERTTVKRNDLVSKRLSLLFAAPTRRVSEGVPNEACPLEGGCIVAGLLLGCTLIVAVATNIDRCYAVLVAPLSEQISPRAVMLAKFCKIISAGTSDASGT